MIYGFFVTIIIQLLLLREVRSRGIRYLLLNPTQLTLGIFYIYCYLGVSLYWHGIYIFNKYDYAQYVNSAYYVLTIMIVFFYLGQITNSFFIRKNLNIKVCDLTLVTRDNVSSLLTIAAVVITAIFLFSIIFAESFRYVYIIRNYIKMLFDSLIVVSLFLFAIKARWRWYLLICYTLISLYLGFRFRLAILLMAFMIYKISILEKVTRKTLIDFVFWASVGLGVIAVLGVTRVYNDVPNLSNLSAYSLYHTIVNGIFNDTSTVLVLGSFVQYMDLTHQFAGFNQLKYIFSAVLPSEIFPNKVYSPILDLIVQSTPNPRATLGTGASVPLVGEFYHTAGIFGVMIFSFSLGYLLNGFFVNTLFSNEKVSQIRLVSYAVIMSWFLNSLTRGYFAQNVLDFFTIILGLVLIKISLKIAERHIYIKS